MKSSQAVWLSGVLGLLCWTASPAAADGPLNGPYIKLDSGWSHPEAMNGSGPGVPATSFKAGSGFLVGGAAGWRFTPLRVELGIDFYHYDLSSASQNSQTVALSGDARNIAVMVNGYYDLMKGSKFEPYLGVGVGAVNFAMQSTSPNTSVATNSSSWAAAVQPMLGLNYALTDHIALGFEYRYLTASNPALVNSAGHTFKITDASHNLLLSLTYRFNGPPSSVAEAVSTPAVAPAPLAPAAPPPAPVATPPAAPPPPATHTFLVFFDFDKASLTPAGHRVIDEAIAAYQHDRAAPIELTGYTDLVGTEDYNLDLSRRRAMTVYAYVLFKGVQPSDIGVDWRGKQNPRIAKPDREPENRRVEIVMP